MGPAYFVIALFGCGDGAADCRTVATPAMRYASERQCLSARDDVLTANSDLDFPTLLATCQAVSGRPSAGVDQPPAPEGALSA